MSIAEFLIEWKEYGLRVAVYNMIFMWLHKNDAHVCVWQEGEECPNKAWCKE